MRRPIALMVLLAGCATSEQNSQTCAGYGFSPGTEPFANCMMKLDEQQSARLSSFGAAMQAAGNNYSARMQSTTCTYNVIGNTAYQTCQ